jgi:chromosome segregation ATPase
MKVEMNSRTKLPAYCHGLLTLACLLAGMAGSQAEPKSNDGGAVIRKAQGIIRELSQQKMALEAEKAVWLSEKSALDAKLKSLEAAVNRLSPLQSEVERYKAGLESVRDNLEIQLAQQRQREQALLQKYNETVSKARNIRDDNTLLVQAVREREQWIEQCSGLNKQLRAVNLEVLDQYREKGLLQQLAELEPLTGIAKVQSESVAEDYRYKLQQLKITPFETNLAAGQAAQQADKPDNTAVTPEAGQ